MEKKQKAEEPARECKLCGGPWQKLPIPMETLQVTAVVEDITRQMGACPKTLVDWATGGGIQLMEKDLLGQVVFPDLLINCSLTTSQESQATI